MTGTTHQFYLILQLFHFVLTQHISQARVIQSLDNLTLLHLATMRGAEQVGSLCAQINYPFQPFSHAYGPGHRSALDFQYFFHLIQDLDWIPPFPVKLVNKSQDRRVPQTAYFHQLDSTRLDTLGHVDNHQGRIHSGQCSVGIFGKILVPGRIQQVHNAVIVGKLHHGRGYGDTPLLFQLHPVGSRMTSRLAALYCTGQLNGTTEQQQLFGQGSFTCVRMRNDGERATLVQFALNI